MFALGIDVAFAVTPYMASWYWHRQGETEPRGPVDNVTLKALARRGELRRQDKVWREGFGDWTSASSVSGLFDVPPPIRDAPTPASHEMGESQASREAEVRAAGDPFIWDSRSERQATKQSGHLQGVGGWLLFFCVALTILGPLVSLGQMRIGWEDAQLAFDTYPELESAVLVENAVVIAIVVYGFITGLMIWNGNENGKLLAERYLKIRITSFVLVELLVVLMLPSLPSEVLTALVGGVFGAVFARVTSSSPIF